MVWYSIITMEWSRQPSSQAKKLPALMPLCTIRGRIILLRYWSIKATVLLSEAIANKVMCSSAHSRGLCPTCTPRLRYSIFRQHRGGIFRWNSGNLRLDSTSRAAKQRLLVASRLRRSAGALAGHPARPQTKRTAHLYSSRARRSFLVLMTCCLSTLVSHSRRLAAGGDNARPNVEELLLRGIFEPSR